MTIRKQLDQRRIPVIGAPMFLVSGPELVIAQCRAGIVGSFPSLNARNTQELDHWIQIIKKSLLETDCKIPFAVNLVALSTSKRWQADLECCLDHEVPIIITSMKPPENLYSRIHRYGGLHFHDVTTLAHAKKAIQAGVDGLVLVCAGAGGHAGQLNPFAFVNSVREIFDGRIALAGSITSGTDVAAAELMGATEAYIGTPFIATQESLAVQDYKQMIVDSSIDDVVYTPEFSGVNATVLSKRLIQLGIDPTQVRGPSIKKPSKLSLWWAHFKNRHTKRWKDIWSAGQGVGTIQQIQSTAEYIDSIVHQYQQATRPNK